MHSKVFEPVSCYLYQLACEAYDRCSQVEEGKGIIQQDAVTAIILSVATAEGFINELIAYSNWCNPVWKSSILGEVEGKKGQLQLKYLLVAHVLGQPFCKGSPPYQDFDPLVKLRNELMHPKQLGGVGDDESFKVPSVVKTVIDRVYHKGIISSATWYGQICTTAVAMWACNTTSEMICAIVEMLPDGEDKDVFEMMFCKWPDGQDCFRSI